MSQEFNETSVANVSCAGQLCPGEPSIVSPHVRSVYYLLTSVFLVVTGVVGNILVLVCVYREKRLRTPSNCLLAHLSAVDLLNCVVTIPGILIIAIIPHSIKSCWYWLKVMPVLLTMSMFLQGLVAVNRYYVVGKRLPEYQRVFSKTRTTIYVVSGWVFTTTFVGLLTALQTPPTQGGTHYCSSYAELNGTRKQSFRTVWGLSLVYFWIGLVYYVLLARFVKNNTICTSKKAQVSVSKVLVVLGIFSTVSILILPAMLLAEKLHLGTITANVFREITEVIWFANYCINPIFFFLKIRLFRETLTRLFRNRSRVAPAPYNIPV